MSSAHFSTEAGHLDRARTVRRGGRGRAGRVRARAGVPPVLGENTMMNFVSFEPHTRRRRTCTWRGSRHRSRRRVRVLHRRGVADDARPGRGRRSRRGYSHGARTHDTPCTEVDVFTPPRRSLLHIAAAQVPGESVSPMAVRGVMDLGLHGRRAMVTGGTKGIGRAVVDELVAEGGAESPEPPRATPTRWTPLAGSCRAAGASPWPAGPPRSPTRLRCTDFIDAAAASSAVIDVLVNNAGAARPGTFETLPTRTGTATWTSSSSPRSGAPARRSASAA